MITIHKAVLSGAPPDQIRAELTGLTPGSGAEQDLAAARLGDLALELAADRDLRVSVITYEDGSQELEVLHAGPPYHTEETIDCGKLAGPARTAPGRRLSLAGDSGLRDAMDLIRATLLKAAGP